MMTNLTPQTLVFELFRTYRPSSEALAGAGLGPLDCAAHQLNSLEEMARKMDLPVDTLLETIESLIKE
jgi:hypothetical protein